MHPTTKDNLASMASWTADIVRADRFVLALTADLPEEIEGQPWHDLANSFGSLTLNLREANSVAQITPYLRLARQCGFVREGDRKEDDINNAVTWNYYATLEGDVKRVHLTVVLHLKAAAEAADDGCRYVQVGVKEVPDMKLLCAEELKAFIATEQESAE